MMRQLRQGLRKYVAGTAPEERVAAEQFVNALFGAQAAFADHLLAALRDSRMDPGVRATAVWFLHMLEDRRAVPLLLRMLQDRRLDPGLRFQAINAMGAFKTKRAVGPLVARGSAGTRACRRDGRRCGAGLVVRTEGGAGRDP